MRTHLRQLDEQLQQFIGQKAFPCVGAKTALSKQQVHCHEYDSLDDEQLNVDILSDLYDFIDGFDLRQHMFSSFVCAFDGPYGYTERQYEYLLWQKLQQLHEIDARLHPWDKSVSQDPEAADFSYSLGGQAFFIICLNPASRRKSRRFESPAIVFNLHQQFEHLREQGRFEQFRDHIRKRDDAFNGEANPMLQNHGTDSEAKQYSGRLLEEDWQCPFHVNKET